MRSFPFGLGFSREPDVGLDEAASEYTDARDLGVQLLSRRRSHEREVTV